MSQVAAVKEELSSNPSVSIPLQVFINCIQRNRMDLTQPVSEPVTRKLLYPAVGKDNVGRIPIALASSSGDKKDICSEWIRDISLPYRPANCAHADVGDLHKDLENKGQLDTCQSCGAKTNPLLTTIHPGVLGLLEDKKVLVAAIPKKNERGIDCEVVKGLTEEQIRSILTRARKEPGVFICEHTILNAKDGNSFSLHSS